MSDSLQPSVHGILQASILEWVAMPSSRGSSQPRGQIQADSLPAELQGKPIRRGIIKYTVGFVKLRRAGMGGDKY